MFLISRFGLFLLAMLAVLEGCAHHALPPGLDAALLSAPASPIPVENPVFIPASDSEFVWNQVVDTVDDYFKIAREDRVRVVGGVVTEGRINTYPVVGATLFEPWRRDSTAGFERLHSTLQPIRRRAMVRVVPVANGYSVEVTVIKELEDVSRPEQATVGGSTIRHDGSLVRTSPAPDAPPVSLGWIPQGRDISLEQQILVEIYGRLAISPTTAAM